MDTFQGKSDFLKDVNNTLFMEKMDKKLFKIEEEIHKIEKGLQELGDIFLEQENRNIYERIPLSSDSSFSTLSFNSKIIKNLK